MVNIPICRFHVKLALCGESTTHTSIYVRATFKYSYKNQSYKLLFSFITKTLKSSYLSRFQTQFSPNMKATSSSKIFILLSFKKPTNHLKSAVSKEINLAVVFLFDRSSVAALACFLTHHNRSGLPRFFFR